MTGRSEKRQRRVSINWRASPTMLSMRSLHSATVLPSNSYYTVVASIFLMNQEITDNCRCAQIYNIHIITWEYTDMYRENGCFDRQKLALIP